MKSEKLLSALTGSILGLLLAAGSIGCLQSAFDLTLSNPAALWISLFLLSALWGLALQHKYGALIFGCLLAVAFGYLWRKGSVLQQACVLLEQLSQVYDRAYHWGVLELTEETAVHPDLPLGLWAAAISLAAVRSVCLPKNCSLPAALALVPFAACIVVTDTVPDEKFLFLLLAGVILLILPASVRREDILQSIRLTAAALLPVSLFLTGLFLFLPQSNYVNQTAAIQENLRTAVTHLPQLMEEGLETAAANFRGNPARSVDLSRLGHRIPFTYPVMEVTASQSGTLYLRGQDYDRYDGLGWTATETRRENFSRSEPTLQTILIRTRGIKQILYLPYHPTGEALLTGGCLDNRDAAGEYSLSWAPLPEDWRKTAYLSQAESIPESMVLWLELPEATRENARSLLEQQYPADASNTAKADIIAALVTNAASYSLTPEKPPAGIQDFTLWFLEEADSGYCIHFATAAAVLLRAADIPARYVTGYMTEVTAGKTVTVTEEDAHAWAEYYEPSLGCWIPLEATPSAAEAPLPETAPATRPTLSTLPATEPEENTPTTVPTAMPETPKIPAEPENTGSGGLMLLLLLPALGLVLAIQRSVRLKLRQKRKDRGSVNEQALRRFREAERLARLLKETPAEELIDLAQKAKYSQHELTREELLMFDSYCRSCLRRLKEKPFWLQLIYQYIYAVY